MVHGGARLLGLVAALLGAMAAGALAAPPDTDPTCGNCFGFGRVIVICMSFVLLGFN